MGSSVSKVYAKPLFELALENRIVEKIYAELGQLNDIFLENPKFIKLLSDPSMSYTEKIEIVKDVLESKIDRYLYNLILILVKNLRIFEFENIVFEFNLLYNEENEILNIKAITSTPMPKNLILKLKHKLQDITSKRINIVTQVDESIIGGIVLEYYGQRLDISVKSKIDNIFKSVKNF